MYPFDKQRAEPQQRRPVSSHPRLIILLAVLLVSLWNTTPISVALLRFTVRSTSPPVRENGSLKWTPCPDNATFYCSFFPVPLDYDLPDADDGLKTVLAMRMFPATVSDSERLGSVFTNPGGPGGSGHANLLRTGPLLSTIFDGKFDIVSWDPRGVNMTTPRVSCHPTDLHRNLYALSHESGDLSFDDYAEGSEALLNKTLRTTDARARLLTELCRDAVGDRVLRSVTTVNVARDLEEMRKAVGDEGLRYWGFSYGTTLGATYVAMFPRRADKVILDGVVYAPEQYTSLVDHGMSAGKSTNGVFHGFLTACISAGPARCALLNNNNNTSSNKTTTPTALSARIHALSTRLARSPLPVPAPAGAGVPSLLHRTHLHSALFSALYRPATWHTLASALAAAERGDGAALAGLAGGNADWAELRRNASDAERAVDAGWGAGAGAGRVMGAGEGGMAVSCGDAPAFEIPAEEGEGGWTKEWLGWLDQLATPNPLGGPNWFDGVVRCRHWGRVQPAPARYEGSWELGGDLRKPKNPVIFVSNSFDPITPITSGRRMVELFGKEHARLLHNNGYGHCSTNHPSMCIAKALKAYMINGTLFDEGTVCEPDEGIMFPPEDGGDSFEGFGGDEEREERELRRTLRLLADAGIGMRMN